MHPRHRQGRVNDRSVDDSNTTRTVAAAANSQMPGQLSVIKMGQQINKLTEFLASNKHGTHKTKGTGSFHVCAPDEEGSNPNSYIY